MARHTDLCRQCSYSARIFLSGSLIRFKCVSRRRGPSSCEFGRRFVTLVIFKENSLTGFDGCLLSYVRKL